MIKNRSETKYVIFGYGTKTQEVTPAYTEAIPKANLNRWKVIWYLLTNRSFKFRLDWTIKYAMQHHDCYRGDGASDVLLFKNRYARKVYNEKKGWK